MVETVDIQAGADIFPELCPFFNLDFVADFCARVGLLHMVERPAGLQGDILIDRTAAGNIVYLHPPADGKDRFLCGQNSLHEPDLK